MYTCMSTSRIAMNLFRFLSASTSTSIFTWKRENYITHHASISKPTALHSSARRARNIHVPQGYLGSTRPSIYNHSTLELFIKFRVVRMSLKFDNIDGMREMALWVTPNRSSTCVQSCWDPPATTALECFNYHLIFSQHVIYFESHFVIRKVW